MVSTGPYMFADQRPGQELRAGPQRQLGPGHRPEPQGAAGPDRGRAQRQRRRHRQPAASPATSTSTSPAPACRPAAQGRILADPTLKANTDNPTHGPQLVHRDQRRRRAVRQHRLPQGRACSPSTRPATSAPTAAPTGGDIATSLLPPVIPGCREVRPLPRRPDNTGDLDQGQGRARPSAASRTASPPTSPTGPSGRRRRRPPRRCSSRWRRSASSSSSSRYPQGDYFKLYAGKPDFAKANNLGLMINGWGADWPDGFGFLSQIVDSRVIRATGGNTNLGVKDPRGRRAARQGARRRPTRPSARRSGPQIDKKVMEDACILPGVWRQGLLYRPPNADERVRQRRLTDVRLPRRWASK